MGRWLPPSLWRPAWVLGAGFSYAVGSLDAPSDIIDVPTGFQFDGATVPLPLRLIVPMAHPNYIQAAALHDWMLSSRRYPRRYADRVFVQALGVLGMPRGWRAVFYATVRLGAALACLKRAGQQVARIVIGKDR